MDQVRIRDYKLVSVLHWVGRFVGIAPALLHSEGHLLRDFGVCLSQLWFGHWYSWVPFGLSTARNPNSLVTSFWSASQAGCAGASFARKAHHANPEKVFVVALRTAEMYATDRLIEQRPHSTALEIVPESTKRPSFSDPHRWTARSYTP